ncbi:hypothetical protein PENSPDRAFT_622436 [Peniophora sp. CONT]|nr:hypothetical protein PENSPDRAFT_622436 [Peniophora sp. CONT]
MTAPSHDLSREEAQEILQKHLPGAEVESLEDFSPSSHIVRINDGRAYLLKLATSTSNTSAPIYAPNSIAAQYSLLTHLAAQPQFPSLPIPSPVAHGIYAEHSYLLTSLPPRASTSNLRSLSSIRVHLSPRASALVDLQIGQFLHRLHEVQNDWFGPPALESEGLWVWQEVFVLLLEDALDRAGSLELGLDVPALRRMLSRAIGSFVFDDAEVPSFVWFIGSEDDIYVFQPESGDTDDVKVVLMLADVENALWADPALERLFAEPSQALLEGYDAHPPLFEFPRQRTKRLWYTLYTALVRLDLGGLQGDEQIRARETAKRVAEELQNATSY